MKNIKILLQLEITYAEVTVEYQEELFTDDHDCIMEKTPDTTKHSREEYSQSHAMRRCSEEEGQQVGVTSWPVEPPL